MALFTDASIVTLDDLLQFENSLVQVSSSHGIDVTSKINLAIDAIGDRLMIWLLGIGTSDPQWLIRRTVGLSTLVVTPTLHRWLCFDSLARFFAEAYNVQLNTRFQGKWTEYQQQSADAANIVFSSGLGIVYQPLPRPAMPIVSSTVTGVPTQSLFLEAAWVDSRGNESAISPANGVIMSETSTLSVSMAGLGTLPLAAAVGWNLYASGTSSNFQRQSSTPLALGASWQLSSTGLVSGPAPLDGQAPNFYIALSRQILRG